MEINTADTLSDMMGWTPESGNPHIRYFPDLVQGSEEWISARLGLLTASEMKKIITPAKLQFAKNGESTAHLYELLAQRVTNYVEPHFISDDMLRGSSDEMEARSLYAKENPDTYTVGFITNNKWGFTLGYSPDGLVGKDGTIECKSRRQKYQIETILEAEIPAEYVIQVQTGLLVSEREWCDFVTYSGGLPMFIKRIYPDAVIQAAIIQTATEFHEKLDAKLAAYGERLSDPEMKLIPTERRIEQEMYI